MSVNRCARWGVVLGSVIGSALISADGGAAGVAMLEQSGSAVGTAMAGTGVSAEDASALYFNPATMTLLPGMQIVTAAHGAYSSIKFSGSGTSSAPLGSQVGGDAGGLTVTANLYFSMPITERLAIGLGINTPFGLKTEYEDGWLGRYQGIKSELRTINFNPAIAFRVNDRISLGAGVSWQRTEVELTNAVDLTGSEGRTRLKVDDSGWGWNLGALFQLGGDMRVGMSYRSEVDYTLTGDATTTVLGSGAVVPSASYAAMMKMTLPDVATVSVLQKYGEKWDLVGDLAWTHWSVLDKDNVIDRSNGALRDELALRFHNSWRVALGVNYYMNEQWSIKGGMAYDRSPVDANNRTVRVPDANRFWVALGAKYRLGKSGIFDLGYAHMFMGDAGINRTVTQTGTAFSTTVNGQFDSSADVLSAQVSWILQ